MKTRPAKSTKIVRALALRDAALTVLRRSGAWATVGSARAASGAGQMKLLSARLGTLEISYRTPFQRLPKAGDLMKHRAAQQGLTVSRNLPYGLDVWTPKKF